MDQTELIQLTGQVALACGIEGILLGAVAVYGLYRLTTELKAKAMAIEDLFTQRAEEAKLELVQRFDMAKATINSQLQTAKDDFARQAGLFEARMLEAQAMLDAAKGASEEAMKKIDELAAKIALMQGMPRA